MVGFCWGLTSATSNLYKIKIIWKKKNNIDFFYFLNMQSFVGRTYSEIYNSKQTTQTPLNIS